MLLACNVTDVRLVVFVVRWLVFFLTNEEHGVFLFGLPCM
jgi:hypothetical protein